jgi:hypothetical protein
VISRAANIPDESKAGFTARLYVHITRAENVWGLEALAPQIGTSALVLCDTDRRFCPSCYCRVTRRSVRLWGEHAQPGTGNLARSQGGEIPITNCARTMA